MTITINLPPEADRALVEDWLTRIPCELAKIEVVRDLDCYENHPLRELIEPWLFDACVEGTCKCHDITVPRS